MTCDCRYEDGQFTEVCLLHTQLMLAGHRLHAAILEALREVQDGAEGVE
jgi:hypothetical protein